ncbi:MULTISPECIES: hypothetical protein [Pseudodesulfovibrio]|nr:MULTISPECIES: hypothetical protein [Pseudodesulfovibrio]
MVFKQQERASSGPSVFRGPAIMRTVAVMTILVGAYSLYVDMVAV